MCAARCHASSVRYSLCWKTHTTKAILYALKTQVPETDKYVFWSLLPSLLCFLPTTGAVLLKSSRRAAGTIAGGAVAIATLWYSPLNREATVVQCFVVTFVGRYASFNPRVEYGGITFALTWHVVVLSNFASGIDDVEESIHVALWRIAMTFAGCVVAMIGSFVLFPSHATVQYEYLTAQALLCSTEVCVLATKDVEHSSSCPCAQSAAQRLKLLSCHARRYSVSLSSLCRLFLCLCLFSVATVVYHGVRIYCHPVFLSLVFVTVCVDIGVTFEKLIKASKDHCRHFQCFACWCFHLSIHMSGKRPESLKVGATSIEVLKEGVAERYLGRKLTLDHYHATELANRISAGWLRSRNIRLHCVIKGVIFVYD